MGMGLRAHTKEKIGLFHGDPRIRAFQKPPGDWKAEPSVFISLATARRLCSRSLGSLVLFL